MTTIRDLSELVPAVRTRAEALLAAAAAAGLAVAVSETYRSPERQAELYTQGRSAPGPRVTNASSGESWHNWRRALDVVFLDSAGQLSWAEHHPWRQLGELGEAAGLKWGGRWRRPDRPHFELPGRCSRGLRLEAHDGQLLIGAGGPPVRELQARLRAAGFDPGRIDGDHGPRTQAAVDALHVASGSEPCGRMCLDAIEELEHLLEQKAGQGNV